MTSLHQLHQLENIYINECEIIAFQQIKTMFSTTRKFLQAKISDIVSMVIIVSFGMPVENTNSLSLSQ